MNQSLGAHARASSNSARPKKSDPRSGGLDPPRWQTLFFFFPYHLGFNLLSRLRDSRKNRRLLLVFLIIPLILTRSHSITTSYITCRVIIA